MVEIQKLQNGVTVILEPNPNAKTVTVAVGVGIGANHEKDNEHGLAHFFEHMCFKGTEKYPNHRQLLTRMDGLGLESNAFTGREYTVYYLSGRPERVGDMVALSSDIFLRSLFPAEELEKEKGVIEQEIAMYEDDPHSKADQEVTRSLFHGTAVEHDILGTVDSVRSFSRDDFVRFLERHYVTENTTISVAGRFDVGEVSRMLEGAYQSARDGAHTEQVQLHPSGVKRRHMSVARKDLEQASIEIGGYGPGYFDTDRFAAKLFGAVLGNGMSSRLFLKVRGELGACYSIGANAHSSAHYGEFSIHVGVNGERAGEVMDAIAKESSVLKRELVSDDEIAKVQEMILSRRAFRQEGSRFLAIGNVCDYLVAGTVESDEEFEKNIKAVTAEDIRNVAVKILNPEKMAVCYVGNTDIPEQITEAFLRVV